MLKKTALFLPDGFPKSGNFFLPSLRGKTRIRRRPSSPGVARFVIAAGNTRRKTGLSIRLGAGGAFLINVLMIIL